MKTGSVLRWQLAWLLILPITFIMSLDRTAMTVSAPIIQKSMGFTLGQMSWILTAFHWAYAAASIPAGLFAARAGARLSLLVANAAWSLFTLAIPFAGAAAPLTALRLALGASQAVDMPASVTAIRNWFPVRERARANAALLAGVYLGPIIGSPLTAWLVLGFGWRVAFLAFGAAGVLSAAVWWLLFRDTPRQHPAASQAERDLIRQGQVDRPSQGGSLRAAIAQTAFWTIGLQGLCTGIVMGFFNTWLPTYLMQARGVALKSLGFFASFPWMILLMVVIGAAVMADLVFRRSGSVWLARVPAAVSGFLIAAIGLFAATRAVETGPALCLLTVALGGMGFVQVSTWATIQDLGGDNTSLLTAWNGMLTNGGAALGPLVMVLLVRGGNDWSLALAAVAAVAMIGAVTWMAIHPRHGGVPDLTGSPVDAG